MLAIIHFNKDCPCWANDDVVNETFVRHNVSYIYDKLKAKGYLYLNEIFEIFGAEWNPDEYNQCFRTEVERGPRFSYQRMDDGEIKISVIW